MNERFKALRLARGWTQGELAELTCAKVREATGHTPAVDAQAISRIERGEITWPSRATRTALRTLLRSDSDADLGLYPKRTRREAEREDATKRRDFIALAGVGLVDSGPKRVGRPDLQDMSMRLARLRELDNFLGGADTFRLYSNELVHTERLSATGTLAVTFELLSQGSQPNRRSRRDGLHSTLGVLMQLCASTSTAVEQPRKLVAPISRRTR